MIHLKILRTLFTVTLFFTTCFFITCLAAVDIGDRPELTLKDVHKDMEKIFKEHVSQKQMTVDLMRHAIEFFVNQFDPRRCYLLAEEAAPFLDVPKPKLYALVRDYENDNYLFFNEMVLVFQQAIERARLAREKIPFKNFEDAAQALRKTPQDFSEQAPFPEDETALDLRITVEVATLLALKEKQGFQPFDDAMKGVFFELEEFENNYLYVDRSGSPLPSSQKENLFAYHLLDAFTGALDAHSAFLSPEQANVLKMTLEKVFEGIGVGIEEQDGRFIISNVLAGGPAEKSGKVKAGDEIIAIDGHKVSNWGLAEVVEHLQGSSGSEVRIQLRSSDGAIFQVLLPRAKIIVTEGRVDTAYQTVPGGIIGEITLHSFYEGASDVSSVADVKRALNDLSQKGPIKGLILDLRYNLGGFLLEAVRVAGLFIKSGVIVISKTSDGVEHFYRTFARSPVYDGPLVILTSKQTASAAEIVASALKDYGRAIIVGDVQTYGKGSIQSQTVTENDKEPLFKVTVGRYYTVSGHSIQLEGVKADVILPSAFLHKKIGERYLESPLSADSVEPAFDDTLEDIDPHLQGLYKAYYLPFLQHPITKYRTTIPELVKKSKARLKANEEYQRFIQGLPLTEVKKEVSGEAEVPLSDQEVQKKVSDMQMQEAINVLKDLIQLSGNGD